ncbi:3209_t:CDS:2, partial [Funneliformis mosseae]
SGFQPTIFKKVSKTAINLWKNQGGGRLSADILLTQFGINTPTNWWTSIELKKGEDHIRKLALQMHAIIPHNATCERVFSILEWYLSKRQRLQAMIQMHSYLVINAKSELKFLNENISLETLDETFALAIANESDLFENNEEFETNFTFEYDEIEDIE